MRARGPRKSDRPSPDSLSEVEVPFLDRDPPPRVARGLADLILLAFAVTVILAFVIELPVTITGPFTLVPERGSDPLRAPRSGIVTEVAALEGQRVEKGETLFRLRSEIAGERAGEVVTLEIGLRGAEERLANERVLVDRKNAADEESERGLTRQASSLARQIALGERRLAQALRLRDQYQKLFDERLTSFSIVEEHALEVTRTEAEIVRLRAEQDQSRSSAERLRRDRAVREQEIVELGRTLHEAAERSRVRLSTLERAPLSAPGDELEVRAPCAGTLVRLHVRAPAAVVAEGAPLCELVCAGEALRAEVAIVDKGMGVVTAGQPVKLYYDAFPYQRHGTRFGTVSFIGPAAVVKPDGPAFRVLAALDAADFQVRGAPYPLLPGMTGRAEIIVSRQSLVAYAFEPVRALRERVGEPR